MSAESNESAPAENGGQQIQVQVSPDLEFTYRDFFAVNVGMEEVILDLGNVLRSGGALRAMVRNHIVLSVPNAMRLQQALARSIEEARKRIQTSRADNAVKVSAPRKKQPGGEN